MTSALDDALRAVVGQAHLLTDPALIASYVTDWTRRFTGTARAVVRPASTAEVAAVLRVCAAHQVAVLVQGGNTGLVGGSVPAGGEVVLSTTRLAGLDPVDVVAGQVSVGAGATLADIQQHVRRTGLDVGVDLAARDSATVGGMVATNAGGIRVCRHGSMRAQVAGIEAVLADGTVVSRLAGLPKDNTGYDLPGLLAGSEGTLAVITRVRLRLVPLLTERAVALLAVPSTAAALRVLARIRALLPSLEAAELFFSDGLALVRSHTGLRAPFSEDHPAYLLVEVAGHADPTDALVEVLGEVAASETAADVLDAVLAEDSRGREDLWRYREAHTESISATGVPVKLDVAVPVARLPELVDALPNVVAQAAPGARVIVFGHLAEGNLHVNVLGKAGEDVAAGPDDLAAHTIEDAVLRLVAGLEGSISAEHGVGRAKVEWLPLSRSAAELTAMRAIKAALDPAGLLNPGVLLPH